MITRVAEKRGKTFPAKLRVRAFVKDFTILWEDEVPYSVKYTHVMDPFNDSISAGLPVASKPDYWLQFLKQPSKEKYELKRAKGSGDALGISGISSFFRHVKGGKTRKGDIEEYWGYRLIESEGIYLFRKMYANRDQTEVKVEDISFAALKNSLGIGPFTLGDLDDDGLDEVIFIEETAKREGSGEHGFRYSDVADFVRVLKWDGKMYQLVWTSPPLAKRGSRILVDDVMGKSKKQIVIGTGHGTIQVWER